MNHIPAIIPSPLVLSTWVDNQWFLRFTTLINTRILHYFKTQAVSGRLQHHQDGTICQSQSDIEGPEVVIEQAQSSKLKYTFWNTLWFTCDFAPRRPCWSMPQIVQKIEIHGLNNSLLQKC
jgi:hypothetical protein